MSPFRFCCFFFALFVVVEGDYVYFQCRLFGCSFVLVTLRATMSCLLSVQLFFASFSIFGWLGQPCSLSVKVLVLFLFLVILRSPNHFDSYILIWASII